MGSSHFTLRVRIGDQEVELGGTLEEVMAALEDLEKIIGKVSMSFRNESMLGFSKEVADIETSSKTGYPTIPQTKKCSEAILNLLRTEWGKTPRTLSELREGMGANAINFPSSTISGTLNWLVKKGRLRRWKGETGRYLYTLAGNGVER